MLEPRAAVFLCMFKILPMQNRMCDNLEWMLLLTRIVVLTSAESVLQISRGTAWSSVHHRYRYVVVRVCGS